MIYLDQYMCDPIAKVTIHPVPLSICTTKIVTVVNGYSWNEEKSA